MKIKETREYIKDVAKLFEIDGSLGLAKMVFSVSYIVGIITYWLIMVLGLTNSDGICEGLTYYQGGDWASSNGRWALRLWNYCTSHNIVMPVFVVIMYIFCIATSVVLITKMWQIKNNVMIAVMAMIMVASPAIIGQMTYIYMSLAYACACLLAVAYVYLNEKCDSWVILGGSSILLACSIGFYQSYIGVACVLAIMSLFLKIIDAKKMFRISDVVRYVVTGCLGCVIYLIVFQIDLNIHHLQPASRVGEMGTASIIELLPQSIINSYQTFVSYFSDTMLHRNIMYAVFFVILAVFIFERLWELYKQKKYIEIAVMFAILFLLLPAANFIIFITPNSGMYLLMEYQMVLIFPFCFAVMQRRKQSSINNLLEIVNCALTIVLSWTFVISGNATYKCYDLSYKHINFETSQILSDIYDLDEYSPGKPIVFAGFTNEDVLRSNVQTYKYALWLTDNVVYWLDLHGARNARYHYLLNYFGIDGGYFSEDEYREIIYQEEFQHMNIWPKDNSIKEINGKIVVKLSDNPPQ